MMKPGMERTLATVEVMMAVRKRVMADWVSMSPCGNLIALPPESFAFLGH